MAGVDVDAADDAARPSLTTQKSWPPWRRRFDSQPSMYLPLSSYLSGSNTAGASASMRLLSAKKSSVA